MSTREVLLHRLTLERATLFHAVEFMPEEDVTRRPVIGEWSVKDVLGHVASWDDEFARRIERFARGEHPGVLGVSIDAWNAEQAQKKWDWTIAQAMEDVVATRRRLLNLVNSLPDDVFLRSGPPPMTDPYVPRLLNVLAEHDREHWDDLMAYKERWIARQAQAVT